MRSLAVSLSSCIYQCLCDSDSFYVNLARATEPGLEGFIGLVLVCHCSQFFHRLFLYSAEVSLVLRKSMFHLILYVV